MRRLLLVFLIILSSEIVLSQVTINPLCFGDEDEITIIYDATLGTSGLVGATKVYMHAGVIIDSPEGTSWQHVVGNWGQDDGVGLMTKVTGETDKWEITLTPRTYFSVPTSETIYRIGMVFRNADGSKEGKDDANGDIFVNLAQDPINLQIISTLPDLVDNGEVVSIEAVTCINATFTLFVDDVPETQITGTNAFSYNYSITQSAGTIIAFKLVADVSGETATQEFSLSVRTPTVSAPRPAGIVDGINYGADPTKVTLSLLAPLKSSVYIVGDFNNNNWTVNPNHQMKKDGEHFWLEIEGLTPGQEYAYQYLVDEAIWVSDPYADKILDPDDQYIPESTYPNLIPFPAGALHSNWYENRASVFQTAQTPYVWQVTDFEKPAKEELVVYELLIRDFFADGSRNYQTLIDTISYFKRLGINAIELMPVMEFNGNEGWGYNPTFMFAPDKYYGTKNKLKEFVDVCHQNGIAVILDIAMNHQDVPNTYASMYFDFVQFKPAANNPWFNVTPKHPFNVFFDMNHASSYTQSYLDTINYYWLNEYKVDGFRFDLSKGFTQKNTGSDVGAWGAYDASRISILKRMADQIWENFPDAYIILEHLSENTEEKELAEYRAGEGKGMMLWGKMTDQYNQNTMGYASNSDISDVYYKDRTWTAPHLVGYMESHDEERLMWKNFEYGNAAGNYNVKTESIALRRMQAAGLVFYTIPGPKMLWQFGELGYDKSINTCDDGSVNPPGAEGGDGDCRLSEKPLPWSYQDNYNRVALFDHTADLIRLKKTYDVFSTGDATISGGSTLLKQVSIKNSPYTTTPADAGEMNVHIVANFDVTVQSMEVTFPHTGTWYDYYLHGLPLEVTTTPFTMELQPGGYKLFTDIEITNPLITSVEPETVNTVSLYPNPVQNTLSVASEVQVITLSLHTVHGVTTNPIRLSHNTWDVSQLATGMYYVEILTATSRYRVKLIKNK